MARPRKFDIDQVLDNAMNAFWSKGYEATSMADLMTAMDLNKGSIYQAFGDKHALFIKALERYTDNTHAYFKKVFATSKTAYEGMKIFLTEALVGYATGQPIRRGCFAVNSLVELGPHDPQAKAILVRQTERIEKLLKQQIQRGQEAGEFRTDIDAEALAIQVNIMLSGIMADCKAGGCRERTVVATETLLKMMSA